MTKGDPAEAGPPLLVLRGIVKSFGEFRALDAVDFDLRAGEIHALLGENGAGKSSLMNVAAGIYTPDTGAVEIAGRPVLIESPGDARDLGIGMVHQHYKLVRPFTVMENLLLAERGRGYGRRVREMRARLSEAADRVGFHVDTGRLVADLSVSEQQRLEVLKLLIAKARILILDEPTALLTDDEAGRLFRAMRSLAATGCAVVLITHKLAEAREHADRITVMRGGRVVRTVRPGEVGDAELTRMIVGESVVDRPQPAEAPGAPLLTVAGLSLRDAGGAETLRAVTMHVRRGEIYGLAGVGGNGQTELVSVLTGLLTPASGRMAIDGREVTGASPARLRRAGIACIPADRTGLALAGGLPVADNFALGGVIEGRFGTLRIDRAGIAREAAEAVRRFEVMGVRGPRQKAGLLSGGNAQKLVIAREFTGSPSIVIAHSPSRGLDMRAAAAVHGHLRAARDRGAAVLMVSEDLDEILLLADRIGVMNRGRIAAEFDAPADRHAIGEAMTGHA